MKLRGICRVNKPKVGLFSRHYIASSRLPLEKILHTSIYIKLHASGTHHDNMQSLWPYCQRRYLAVFAMLLHSKTEKRL